jgi:hypothetical protein
MESASQWRERARVSAGVVPEASGPAMGACGCGWEEEEEEEEDGWESVMVVSAASAVIVCRREK